MSGIAGIYNIDRAPVDRALLQRMTDAIAHRGPDGIHHWVEGSVGMGHCMLQTTPESVYEKQPVVGSSGVTVVFDGRLDNREELLPLLKGCPGASSGSPDSSLVLASYEVFGEAFVEKLNGDFALGLFDPGRQQLLLARDCIGVRPLYYFRIGETFVFASEVKALIAHPEIRIEPNDDAFAEFLLGAPYQQNQALTFFRGILSLLPAHLLILTTSGLTTRRYWDFDPSHRTVLGSLREYSDAFRDRLTTAVRRRLRTNHPVATTVSGGLDSSSIFGLSETLRRSAETSHPITFALSHSASDGSWADENAFVADIEGAYGVGIERIPIGPTELLNGWHGSVLHTEDPLVDLKWGTTHALLSSASRRGAKVLLSGHWGDEVLFDQAYLLDLFGRLEWRTICNHLNEYGRWYTEEQDLSRFFKRLFLRQLVARHVPQVLRPTLRSIRNAIVKSKWDAPWCSQTLRGHLTHRSSISPLRQNRSTSAHFNSLYWEVRSGYPVMCMEWNNKIASMFQLEHAFPFLDRDLLSFLMSLPGEAQTWGGVPKALLREAMTGIVPITIRKRTWKGDFTDKVAEGIDHNYCLLSEYLLSHEVSCDVGYVDRKILRTALADFRNVIRSSTNGIPAANLGRLVGVEIWLRTFLQDTKSTKEDLEYAAKN
jgi:asparagine synthase (glutamine-hydrolysing)